jgi:transcriptional regulator NrdR family protein
MRCPHCECSKSRVTQSSERTDSTRVRQHACCRCRHRYVTHESIVHLTVSPTRGDDAGDAVPRQVDIEETTARPSQFTLALRRAASGKPGRCRS